MFVKTEYKELHDISTVRCCKVSITGPSYKYMQRANHGIFFLFHKINELFLKK